MLFLRKILLLASVNLALLFALIAIIEFSLSIFSEDSAKAVTEYPEDYFIDDHPYLGYAPKVNMKAISRRLKGDREVYKVTYSINKFGLRVSPPPTKKNAPSILFFGDSFTFGEGVNDNETLPYMLANQKFNRFAVFNFGFHGYGPHQMLASIENGHVELAIGETAPQYIIYQALVDHPIRASGTRQWDFHGPLYALDSRNDLIYQGPFKEANTRSNLENLAYQFLHKFTIGQIILKHNRRPDQKDIELMMKIIQKSQTLLQKKWPSSQFHILFWDQNNETSAALIKGFNEYGFNIHIISKDVAALYKNKNEYFIQHDGHPNARGYEILSEYVANQIVRSH